MAFHVVRNSVLRGFMALALTLSFLAFTPGCATTPKKNYVAVGNQYAKDGLLREASEAYKKALAQRPGNPYRRKAG